MSQLSNVRGFQDVRQIEKHRAEPLLPEPSAAILNFAIERLKTTNHHVLAKF